MGVDNEVFQKNYVKKNNMKRFSLKYPIQYVLEKQRLVCLLIGIGMSVVIFSLVSVSSSPLRSEFKIDIQDTNTFVSNPIPRRIAYELVDEADHNINAGMVTANSGSKLSEGRIGVILLFV